MKLLRNGILQIPLFHGTSAIFESSLRSFGLGGRDPIGELRIHDLFKELVPLCQRRLAEDEAWKIHSIYARNIVEGRSSEGNWRYGAVYLTPSKGRAVRHASNMYGSELLSITADLVARLKQHAKPEYRELARRYAPVFKLFRAEHQPLLVQVDQMPLSLLKAEDGGSPVAVLERAEALKDYFDDEVFFAESVSFPFGFELTAILPPTRFSIIHL